jgi:GT2 family glycosyltransferase
MKVTVGICTKNRKQKLLRCLTALAKQSDSIDQLIILEDTTDQQNFSQSSVQKMFPRLKKTQIKYDTVKFSNIAKSRTALLNMVKNGMLIFIDDDVVVTNNSLQKVKKFFDAHKTAALVIGKVLPLEPKNLISHIDSVYFNQEQHDANKIVSLDFCPFSFVGINVSAIRKHKEKITSFDPNFPIGEDVDFSLRLSLSGQKIFFDPKIRNYHQFDTSFVPYLFKKVEHGKYIYLLYQKHKDRYVESNALPLNQSLFSLLPFIWHRASLMTKYYSKIYSFSFAEKIIVFCGEVATLLGSSLYKFTS